MRITGGKLKGRPIYLNNKNTNIRPTSDFVREAVFQIISNYFSYIDKPWDEILVLDLFCGTGSLGIEALSRGAKKVIFVDFEHHSLENTSKNLKNLKIETSCNVLKYDLSKNGDGLSKILTNRFYTEKFHLILADPPYSGGFSIKILETVAKNQLLADEGIFILEEFKKSPLPDRQVVDKFNLTLFDARNYGQTRVSFYTQSHSAIP